MTVLVNIPSYIIKQYQDEALAKIRKDLSNVNYQNVSQNGLLSNRAAAWSLGYINSCSKNEETGGNTLFPLIVRNRELEELQKNSRGSSFYLSRAELHGFRIAIIFKTH